MDESVHEYLKAMLPQSYNLMGCKLLPFSFGHYILLSANRSPFVADSMEPAEVSDLLTLVGICSRTWEENLEFIKDDEAMKAWMNDLVDKYVNHLQEENLVPDWDEKIVLAARYIAEHNLVPVWDDAGNESGGPSGIYWGQDVIIRLSTEAGYKDRESVLNAPYGQVRYDYDYLRDKDGSIRILDQFLVEMINGPKQKEEANTNANG